MDILNPALLRQQIAVGIQQILAVDESYIQEVMDIDRV